MQPEVIAITIIILLFSVIVHEVMHGWVALRFGDRTAERSGRLTLNPLPHIDPIGSILVPALLFFGSGGRFTFGWAKPVPVNPLNFSDIRKGELFVSLAGVISNFILAIAAAMIFRLVNPAGNSILSEALVYTVGINLVLAVFNLLPIPPLDGSKVLMSQLPYNLAKDYQRIEPYGFLILMALILFNITDYLYLLIVQPLARLLLGV